MRDEFLEPLPTKQSDATLLFGKTAVPGYIVAVTDEGFCVGVPGIERYEGDPRLTLATETGVFRVKLVLQEKYVDGFYFWLMHNTEVDQSACDQEREGGSRQNVARYGLAGIVAATLAFCVGTPSSNDGTSLFGVDKMAAHFPQWWSRPVPDNTAVPPANATEQVAAVTKSDHKQSQKKSVDRARASASMISQASMSTSSSSDNAEDVNVGLRWGKLNSENNHLSDKQSRSAGENDVSLKSLLEAGQIGRIQTITESLVPWLYGPGLTEEAQSIRISDAAWFDLRQFEAGLRSLPKKASSDAISRLRVTLIAANAETTKANRVPSMPKIFVINSDDANIYFKVVRGRMELVRVLPIDFHTSE